METLLELLFQYVPPPAGLLVICMPFTIGGSTKGKKVQYPGYQFPKDNGLRALGYLKDWSNYLLVTTVVVLGWVVKGEIDKWIIPEMKSWCVWSFGLSLVFGILTLALIPLVTEIYKGGESIYDVRPHFDIFGGGSGVSRFRIKHACRPQHLLFIAGVFLFIIGSKAL